MAPFHSGGPLTRGGNREFAGVCTVCCFTALPGGTGGTIANVSAVFTSTVFASAVFSGIQVDGIATAAAGVFGA